MQLTVNGSKRDIGSETISVSDLLRSEAVLKTEGIAVAVNQNVIPKTEWEQTFLKENDTLLIIKATQGG
ncbi:MAG: sulfur carrier protein ThiS [Bacteroidia bacterium]|nr:sulfur carrier protein ThiS [Bacteroidia bacterium]